MGLDTIEAGAAIGVFMDAGRMELGDAEGAKRLLRETGEGTKLGRRIGHGADEVGRQIGHHRIPTVRGQAIPAWDPRPLKATGVTYASSAMGADHTAELVMNPGLPAEEWAAASQKAQIIKAICDASGFCMFIMPTVDDIRRFYAAYFDEELDPQRIADLRTADRRGRVGARSTGRLRGRARRPPRLHEAGVHEEGRAIGLNGDLVFNARPEIIAAVRKRCVSTEELCGGEATG